jgi:hypothetical protein
MSASLDLQRIRLYPGFSARSLLNPRQSGNYTVLSKDALTTYTL